MDGRAYGWSPPRRQPACAGLKGILAGQAMTKVKDDKAERLAAALRENLRRRKAQSREMTPRETQPKKEPTQAAKE